MSKKEQDTSRISISRKSILEYVNQAYLKPMRECTIAIPLDRALRDCYNSYQTSKETKILVSEFGRTIYADAFIPDRRLGPLSDLCVVALAQFCKPNDLVSIITDDPQKLRIYYENLSIDLPLEDCYHVKDEQYWRRVAMAKTHDKTLPFHKHVNWKHAGIALKYVELVEACPAEYWPEEEMKALAMKVKKYVTEIHLKRLKTLTDHSFSQRIDIELAGSSSESSSVSYFSSSDEEDDDAEDNAVEEAAPEPSSPRSSKGVHVRLSVNNEKEARRSLRRQKKLLAEAKKKRREARALSRKRESLRFSRVSDMRDTVFAAFRSPKEEKESEGVFDIEVEPPEYDGEDKIIDRRNLHRLLDKDKRYRYPEEDCHHIDLRFVRFFPLLVTFSLEFMGPHIGLNYHTKHFNFSSKDMEHLAYGLTYLPHLRFFRLSNSRMNAKKLHILTRSLKHLKSIESVDFNCDQLEDDCGEALYELFKTTPTITSLELGGNQLGVNSLQKLSEALKQYKGTLEYLGLARNLLEDDGLHVLNAGIIGTKHVSHLSIAAASISQNAISCCVANELLRRHRALRKLNISAIHIIPRTGEELLKALERNLHLMVFDCRDCDLTLDMELEAEVLIQRNHYVNRNPFVGNMHVSADVVDDYLTRLKNPILIKALTASEERASCWFQRPSEGRRLSNAFDRLRDTKRTSHVRNLPDLRLVVGQELAFDVSSEESSKEEHSLQTDGVGSGTFMHDANTMDREKLKKYASFPGPGERYYYFRERARERFG